MGTKAKQKTDYRTDREKRIEALYFARKCGLTKDEALKMLSEAPIGMDDRRRAFRQPE
ncbi:hypothetical protein [Mesorhizobium australicum]|uniref:hypothetical protein n=1 Tax=Mesorhizobium australicum TaxID=536018 RepID=UPI00333B19FE